MDEAPPFVVAAAAAAASAVQPAAALSQLKQAPLVVASVAGMTVVPSPPVAPVSTAPPPSRSSTGNARRSWDENYAQLLIYKAMHSNCEVPYGYKNDPVLGKWVSHLRENQDHKLMSPERKAALNAIGFNWNPQENRWNEQFEKLKDFARQFGTTKIPAHFKDRQLCKWVKRQRENRSSGILQEHRAQKLDSIGFVWKLKDAKAKRNNKVNEEQWKKQYDKLVLYKEENGHCNCPKTYEKDPSLGKWVSKQRLQNNRNVLTKDRKKLLEEIGFVFSFQAQKKQQEWNHMFQLLKACQKGGSEELFIVPKTGPEASSVARWVQRQREKYKTSKLDPGREVLLRKINFPFPPLPQADDDISDAPSSDVSKEADDMVAVVVDAMQRDDDALQTAEDQSGKKIAQCIDVLAQYMSTSPAELAARLPLSSKRPLVDHNHGANHPTAITTAFGRLMPRIVALRDVAIRWSDDTCLKEAQNFLEQVLLREKAEAPNPFAMGGTGNGGSYVRLLSLAVELGTLLDHSKRCHAVVRSCEMYLEHLMSQKEDGSHGVAAVSMTEVSTGPSDDSSLEPEPYPAAKRRKIGVLV